MSDPAKLVEQWQKDRSEFHMANIVEIVTEYAEWREPEIERLTAEVARHGEGMCVPVAMLFPPYGGSPWETRALTAEAENARLREAMTNARDNALEEAAEMVMNLPLSDEDADEAVFEGARDLVIVDAIRALKARAALAKKATPIKFEVARCFTCGTSSPEHYGATCNRPDCAWKPAKEATP